MVKKIGLLVILISFSLFSCFVSDPLFQIRRLARSNSLDKKNEALGQYKKAIDTLVDAYREYASLNKEVANRLMFNKQFLPAIKHLDTARDLNSNDSEIYYWLGVCYINLYKTKKDVDLLNKAEENYKIAMNISPNYPELLYSYAQLLIYAKNDYKKAISVLSMYLDLNDDDNPDTIKDPDGYFLLARAYYLDKQFEEAKRIYGILSDMESLLTTKQKKALDNNIFILSQKN